MFVCKDQKVVELIMMAGNPSWWNMDSNLRSAPTTAASDHHHHNHHHDHHQEVGPNLLMISQTHPSNTLSWPGVQYLHDHHHQHAHDFPHSWSQLLLGGLGSDHQQEERFGPSLFQSTRMMSNNVVDVKQEVNSQNTNNNNNKNNVYGYNHHHEEQETAGISNRPPPAAAVPWSHSSLPASSPKSCVTSLSSTNNILDFSTSKRSLQAESHQHVDHSNSECHSTATGGAPNKKPRVQSSSNPPLKVRKEKLGDRITALHQLVSPFGKTDTASVLLEAIGYIRFLQGQIEALSSPYLGGNNASAKHPHAIHGERSCLFPDHPGQLLNDSCLKRRVAANQEEKRDAAKDLKTRGLCLVPISCTQLVGSDNGADYWAPSLGGGF